MPVDRIKMKLNNSVTRDVYEAIRKEAKGYPYNVDVVFDESGTIAVRFKSEYVPGSGEALSVGGRSTGSGQMIKDAGRMAQKTWKKMVSRVGRMIDVEWDDMQSGNTKTVLIGTLGSDDLQGGKRASKMASELVRIAKSLVGESEWEEIGPVVMDSGLLMVGDPGYQYSTDTNMIETFGNDDWKTFLDENDDFKEPTTINRPSDDEPGLAVVLPMGGDGQKSVYVKRDDDDIINEIKIAVRNAKELVKVAKDLVGGYNHG